MGTPDHHNNHEDGLEEVKERDIGQVNIEIQLCEEEQIQQDEWKKYVLEAKSWQDCPPINKEEKKDAKSQIKRTYLRQYVKARTFMDD